MRICLNLDPSRFLRWHLWLAEALAEVPSNEVSCAFAASHRPLPLSCRLLLELERLVYGLDAGATEPVEAALRSLPPPPANEVDVVIDLSGEEPLPAGRRVLTPRFNGMPAEIGIMTAWADDQDFLVDLHDTARPMLPWTARPASADREVFAVSLDGVLSCAVALILKALREQTSSAVGVTRPGTAAASPRRSSALASATGAVASKAVRFLDILARGGRTWGIAWRIDQSASLLDTGDAAYRVLTGGTDGYLADPFPFPHQGRNFIFVEKFLYGKNRGCIAVVTVDSDGTRGAPQIVLEEPHHLSYPFVFEQDGQIWMIPESGEARNVCLYKAVEFPHRWTRHACLIEGIEGYDTTLLRRESGFWFFVSLRLWKSTSWDVLSLYHTESLAGAWTSHAANPVLIDAALSRPAGTFIQRGGRTLRPVQDCTRGYGGGVTLCQIDALGESEFAQTPIGRIGAEGFGCHTYNRRSGLEVIDLFGNIRALREVRASYRPLACNAPTSRGIASGDRPS